MGKLSRVKGRAFEQLIAQDMRQVYDSADLLDRMTAARLNKEHKELRRLQKESVVRRSDQGKGAKEPDLVIDPCPCWLELQNASGVNFNPEKKLAQAERDVDESKSHLWPVSVCRKTGSTKIYVCTRLWTVLLLMGLSMPKQGYDGDLIVTFDYDKFIELLNKNMWG